MEVLSQIPNLGYLFVPIGGGGLAAGISSYMKACAPQVKVIGVEPKGAAGMQHSLAEGAASAIPNVNTICDGVAVRLVGELCYEMCNQNLIVLSQSMTQTCTLRSAKSTENFGRFQSLQGH